MLTTCSCCSIATEPSLAPVSYPHYNIPTHKYKCTLSSYVHSSTDSTILWAWTSTDAANWCYDKVCVVANSWLYATEQLVEVASGMLNPCKPREQEP